MTPTTPERWLPVVGYEGKYEISDLGRVRGVDRVLPSRGGTRLHRGKILKPQWNAKTKRFLVDLYAGNARRMRTVSTLVGEAFFGACPEGFEICHNNGDSSDDRATNLRWDSRSENNHDRVRHGTHHNAIKTHCPEGHEYAGANLVMTEGRRRCRECTRKRQRKTDPN